MDLLPTKSPSHHVRMYKFNISLCALFVVNFAILHSLVVCCLIDEHEHVKVQKCFDDKKYTLFPN